MRKLSKRHSSRELSRLYAIMGIYQLSHSDSSLDQVIRDFLDADFNYPGIDGVSISDISRELFVELLTKTQNNIAEIDLNIKLKLDKRWTFNRMDPVMISFLRIATCELLFYKHIHSYVVFKTYSGLAKLFFEEYEINFLIGILNGIARNIRDKSEFAEEKQ